MLLLSGCVGVKYLEEDETVLYKQQIEGNRNLSNERLARFFRQKPNRQFPIVPFTPYVYIHGIGDRFYNEEKHKKNIEKYERRFSRRIEKAEDRPRRQARLERRKERKIEKETDKLEDGNMLMQWGEEVSVYDSAKAYQALEQIRSFYKLKGYINSEVELSSKTRNNKTTVTYKVKENRPHRIDSILYDTQGDSTLLEIIMAHPNEKKIKKGDVFDQDVLSAERSRIDELLKKNGYFEFSQQFIRFRVDTTIGDHAVAVRVNVLKPSNRDQHKQFRIDSVIVTYDSHIKLPNEQRTQVGESGVTFSYFNREYSEKILRRRVFLQKGELYNIQNHQNTQRQMGNMDIFRFINISYDTTGGDFIANIITSPLKKYQTSNEAGLTVSQGFPGPFYNLSLKNRNPFQGLEIMELNFRAGIEGVASATEVGNVFQSTELGANLSLIFPQFILPLSEPIRNQLGARNPKTRLLMGYNYINRPEYVRTNVNTSITYNWQAKDNIFINFTPADLRVIESTLDPAFQDRLEEFQLQGNNLIESFRTSFVSSMIFNVVFNFDNYGLNNETGAFLKLHAESGGTLLNFFGKDFITNQGLEYFQFAKFFADYRKNIRISRDKFWAFRVHGGFARPYNGDVLPYEKYFFAGGTNSLRAWRPRRLGLGSSPPSEPNENPVEDGFFDYSLEQPGEILLEASMEYRAKLFGFFHWAFFIDAGNVWSNSLRESRPGAEFTAESLINEIAVGTGLGLRLDFNFLVLRLDFGVKAYDPARPSGEKFMLPQLWRNPPFGEAEQILINIGIGYPF